MIVEDNANAIILLRQFKEKYNLTWNEVSEVFGRKLPNIERTGIKTSLILLGHIGYL
jgi:hypothetical protein